MTDLVARSYQLPGYHVREDPRTERTYSNGGFALETAWEQTATVGTLSLNQGTLQVCYREERPEADEGPFSEEERDLIESIGHSWETFSKGG